MLLPKSVMVSGRGSDAADGPVGGCSSETAAAAAGRDRQRADEFSAIHAGTSDRLGSGYTPEMLREALARFVPVVDGDVRARIAGGFGVGRGLVGEPERLNAVVQTVITTGIVRSQRYFSATIEPAAFA